MESRRLLLLGLLQVQEQHGYQLMDFVERNLPRFTDLKKPTVYYELKRMEHEELVAVRREQEGGRPPRRVYRLTPAGEAAFRELLRESLRDAQPPTCAADIGLLFADWLPPAESQALLAERVSRLQEQLQAYREAPSHGKGSAIDRAIAFATARLEHEIGLLEAWMAELAAGDPAVRAAAGGTTGEESAGSGSRRPTQAPDRPHQEVREG